MVNRSFAFVLLFGELVDLVLSTCQSLPDPALQQLYLAELEAALRSMGQPSELFFIRHSR